MCYRKFLANPRGQGLTYLFLNRRSDGVETTNLESRTASGTVLDRNFPFMCSNTLGDDRETKTGPPFLSGKTWLE